MKVLSLIAVTALAVAGFADAACPNSCSGHGSCSSSGVTSTDQKNDMCTCYKKRNGHAKGTLATTAAGRLVDAWTGYDCSEMTCPYGYSFASQLGGQFAFGSSHTDRAVQDGHDWKECSGQGKCNRQSGGCECFPGYEGSACERQWCANSCSGHGTCQTQQQFYADAETFYGTDMGIVALQAVSTDSQVLRVGMSYSKAWDALIIYGCKCDPGYHGPDCSLKNCVSKSDPLGGPGNSNGQACSGRGICDGSSGICTCFPGFYGTGCESVTSLI